MTCIIGLAHEGRVYIGADSARFKFCGGIILQNALIVLQQKGQVDL
jgi:hypothetical protein